jgi:transposase-like protein
MPASRKLLKETPQIVDAYVEGNMTLRALAALHGVANGTIRNILLREGVDLRRRGRQRKTPRNEPSLPQEAPHQLSVPVYQSLQQEEGVD